MLKNAYLQRKQEDKICRIINIQTKKKSKEFLEKLEVGFMNYSRNFAERYMCVQSIQNDVIWNSESESSLKFLSL